MCVCDSCRAAVPELHHQQAQHETRLGGAFCSQLTVGFSFYGRLWAFLNANEILEILQRLAFVLRKNIHTPLK